jgi:hypothetical protein
MQDAAEVSALVATTRQLLVALALAGERLLSSECKHLGARQQISEQAATTSDFRGA